MSKFRDEIEVRRADADRAIDVLANGYEAEIARLKLKLNEIDDMECLWTDFQDDPTTLSKEELDGLFQYHEKRAAQVGAYIQAREKNNAQ